MVLRLAHLGCRVNVEETRNVIDQPLGLNIGCGDANKDGLLGLDVRRTDIVDFVADARSLPFRDGVFEHVYSSHTIEHFSYTDTRTVLIEWLRVLRVNGVIELRCPDLRARALLFALRPRWSYVRNIYGAQDHEFNFHKAGFSYGLLRDLLSALGVSKIQRINSGYKGVPFLPDSLHVKGIKSK